MYEVGAYVVHPGQGVCQVDEVVSDPQPTYMLMPVGTRHPMRISFPVSSEDRLRPVLTHDEAAALMDDPDSGDARAVIALAKERFADRLEQVAVN